MRKVCLSITCLLLFVSSSFAQPFSKKYSNLAPYLVTDVDVTSWKGGFCFGLGEKDVSHQFRQSVSLLQVDAGGNLQHAFHIETADTGYSINCSELYPTSAGDLLLSGAYAPNNTYPNYPFLMALDSNLNLKWAQQWSLPGVQEALSLYPLGDSTLLGTLKYNDGSQHRLFFKLGPTGQVSSIHEMSPASPSLIRLRSHSQYFELLLSDGNLLRISNDLSQVDSQGKFYHQSGINFTRAGNGDLLLASCQTFAPGYLSISRFDPAGNPLWCKKVESWMGSIQNQGSIFDGVGVHFIKETADGHIVVVANSEGGLNGSFVLVLDSSGNYLSNYKTSIFKEKVLPYGDQQFLSLGSANSAQINGSGAYFERHDLLSPFGCDSSLSYSMVTDTQVVLNADIYSLNPVASFSTQSLSLTQQTISPIMEDHCNLLVSRDESPDHFQGLRVYPNPSSGIVYLKSTIRVEKLILYDTSGRLLWVGTGKQIDLSRFPTGVYFLEIRQQGKVHFKKLIHQASH